MLSKPFLVEVAGKRGIKQLIIVFDDAPEQNKELKERGTSDAQRLCLRAVGEPRSEFESNEKKKNHSNFYCSNDSLVVEVAGLELAASSSRTNTPLFFDYFC